MKRIERKNALEFCFDGGLPPVLRVDPGEKFVIETEDATAGALLKEGVMPTPEDIPEFLHSPPKFNPVGGPVYVEGAEKGDLLAVKIEEVIPDDIGTTCLIPGMGPLGDSLKWGELAGPEKVVIKHLPGPSGTTKDGTVVVTDRLRWKVTPFIGTIGVAPEFEVRSSFTGQGYWGGNMDCRDIKPGSTVFFNCYNEGGLLFLGDVHASQGDTEFTGAADETRGEVLLSCDVIKGKSIPGVRIEKEGSIITLSCEKPMEEGVKIAIVDLMSWLMEEYGFTQKEAYLTTTLNPDFRVNVYQMVKVDDLRYTVGAELPKKYL